MVYLNATPFWAFMPRPDTQDGIGRLLRRVVGYDGVMPAPERLKAVIRRLWWDKFTTEDTIRGVLEQVYHYRCVLVTQSPICEQPQVWDGHALLYLWTAIRAETICSKRATQGSLYQPNLS